MMNKTAEQLRQIVSETALRLSAVSEAEALRKPGAEKWSRKEILGHLIDSASNNHQRFVRAQFTARLEFPGYTQNQWNAAQRYQEEPWFQLVELWASYNRHIAHVIDGISAEASSHLCVIGEGAQPVTLGFLVQDYVSHMLHHLRQIDAIPGN
jgi:DinB family protein